LSNKKEIKSAKLYSPPGGGVFTSAIEAPAGRTIYISGLTSRDVTGTVVGDGDIKLQTETVLKNIQAILGEVGGTLDDIVRVTVYIRNMEDFAAIHEVRRRYFTQPYPASTMVEVSRLVDNRLLIEIDAVAVIE